MTDNKIKLSCDSCCYRWKAPEKDLTGSHWCPSRACNGMGVRE